MKPRPANRFHAASRRSLCLAALSLLPCAAIAGPITKSGTGPELTTGTNWIGNAEPTSSDIATWNSSSLGAGLTLGSTRTWGGIAVTGALTDIGITGSTLTINGGGIDLSTSTVNLTIANGIALGAAQSWTVASGKTLTANGAFTGNNLLTVSGSGTTKFGGTSFATSSLSVSAGATAEFTANGGGVTVPWALTGTGTYRQSGTTSLRPTGNNSAFAGTYELTAGDMTFGTAATADIPNQWSPNATYALNGGSLYLYQLGASVVEFGALSGTSSTSKIGCWNSGTPTVKVGALGTDTTFAGQIVNVALTGGGPVAFAKTGSGKQTLTGTNTYTGTTTINSGTLEIAGAGNLGNGSYAANITNNGTLALNSTSAQTLGGIISGNGALTKANSGVLTLTGANSYTGTTTVSGGTLAFSGAGAIPGSPTIDVQSGGTLQGGTYATGQTLKGNGTLTNAVTMASGSTLSPAGTGVIGSMTMDGSLSLAGNTVIDINKSGATLTSDSIAGVGSVNYGGTLTVNATGGTLALGDTFTLFPCSGGYSGSFTAYVLPALPAGLSWDKSNLSPTGNGTITVVNFVGAPYFTPLAGNYVGAQSVSITSDAGSTIYYTLDGSTPTASSPHTASPVTGITVPTDSSMTIKAYAIKAGQADSPLSTATYTTITTPTWNVDNNGNWSDAANWLSNVVPDGTSVPADFSVMNQGAPTNVTLDGNRTVGSLKFGNANAIDWLLNSPGGSVLTLAKNAGTPAITVLNNAATISAVLAGNQGLMKDGSGTLTLSANNTYTGTTTVNSGSVIFSGSSFAMTGLNVAGGATATFNNNSGSINLPAPITGSGTVIAEGMTGNSGFRPTGNNQAFTGTFLTQNGGSIDFDGATAGWSANASYVLNGATMRFYNMTGTTIELGALSGTNAATQIGTWNAYHSTLSVGALGTDTTYAGRIVNTANGNAGGTMTLVKVGTGTLTLAGANNYTGNTTVSAGTLHLADNGQLAFALGATSGVCNSISGAGTLVLDGDFVINTAAAAALTTGTWTLENVPSLTGPYGSTFTVIGFTDAGNDKWTKTEGSKLWTFDETTGVLTLGVSGYSGWASSHGIAGEPSSADHDLDGINNGMEYALGLSPTVSNGTPGTFSGGVLTFTKGSEAITNGDVTYVIEESDDLGLTDPWSAVVTQTPPNADPTISYTLPTGSPRKFARLRVTIQ